MANWNSSFPRTRTLDDPRRQERNDPTVTPDSSRTNKRKSTTAGPPNTTDPAQQKHFKESAPPSPDEIIQNILFRKTTAPRPHVGDLHAARITYTREPAPGVAGEATLEKGSILFHGSPSARFRDLLGQVSPSNAAASSVHPTPPFFCSMDNEFAAHAAARRIPYDTGGEVFLHTYNTTADTKFLVFRNLNDLTQYAESLRGDKEGGLRKGEFEQANKAYNSPSLTAAMAKHLQGSGYHGFIVQEDAVRGQAELVLFNTATTNSLGNTPIEIHATSDRHMRVVYDKLTDTVYTYRQDHAADVGQLTQRH